MADFTTEDAKENQKVAGDDVVSCSKGIADDNIDNAISPHSEAPDVKKEMAPQPEMPEPDPRGQDYTLLPNCAIEEEEGEGEGGGGGGGEEEDVKLGSNSQKVGGADEDDSSLQDQVILKKELETKKVLMPLESFSGIILKSRDGKGLNEVQGAKSCSDTENKEREVQDTRLCSDIENDEERVLSIENHGFEMVTENETKKESVNASAELEVGKTNELVGEFVNTEKNVQCEADMKPTANTFVLDKNDVLVDEPETEEDQAAFMKELEAFHKVRCLEFKPPKFYGEPLNCLKLWRAVIRLGGYEQVTACKLWRQVGESFNPPKTCTTVSWTFRGFYEKALLEYEKHKMRNGELPFNDASFTESSSISNQAGLSPASGSGRARRDAAARAMQGWHTQRLLGNGEVGDPIIKDKNSVSTPKREKQLKSVGLLKRKKISPVDHSLEVARQKTSKLQLDIMVVDIGPPADWVKINVQRTKDCFEVYALVPGLLREEVRVQSDPAGRLVITGQPEQVDNPWGVMPFKKVVSLPSRIDPHQTSAVVTLHGQLFVRVPFEQSDM